MKNFEAGIRSGAARLLSNEGTEVIIDAIDFVPRPEGRLASVTFHLEGAWSSPVQFSFPFFEWMPLAASFEALRDMISRHWQEARKAPVGKPGKKANRAVAAARSASV